MYIKCDDIFTNPFKYSNYIYIHQLSQNNIHIYIYIIFSLEYKYNRYIYIDVFN